jgi:hypothetical protein
MACSAGKIRRRRYSRKTRSGKVVKVRASCITDRGKKGKGPFLITGLKKGKLSRYGYSTSKSPSSRHASLRKAVKAYGGTSVIRKLNAVKVLNRNTNPRISKIFGSDMTWVQKIF